MWEPDEMVTKELKRLAWTGDFYTEPYKLDWTGAIMFIAGDLEKLEPIQQRLSGHIKSDHFQDNYDGRYHWGPCPEDIENYLRFIKDLYTSREVPDMYGKLRWINLSLEAIEERHAYHRYQQDHP